ncbi:OMP85 family outer membrane protein [Pseudomonas saudimassiliensis]|uniref:Translocation and assembly module subunit TamA n=1 Tax=Pseudomonas saudimassiliensis TaxID=1461581 RepID=A0A078MFW0_9PSED|nr:autotransporter assembly complex family protein [Pseudomonas saudimassiliensis]CEA05189.1 OMP85 family outer membrane protein [Pseudomonas saudimassiliensis]CEF27011.1 OMP85 family outer membrane protein [Pseudomonas saudimassiliensis]
MVRFVLLLALLLLGSAARGELKVQVEPRNDAARNNIEAFIGPVTAPSREAMWRLARSSREQAISALQALGYYHPQVRPRVIGDDTDPVLLLEVTLGEPVLLDDVVLEVSGAGQGTEYFSFPPSRHMMPGAQLHHGHYEDTKSLLQNQALQYGYFSAEFLENRLLIDVEENLADVVLRYDTGERYRLGEVSFSETPFDLDLLQRMVPFRNGVPYEADLLAEFNRELLASGYFEAVQVTAPADLAVDGEIPVQADLKARKPHSLGFGGGFSTDVGPRVKADWTQHWLNSRGHSRGAELELAAPRQKITSWYQIPLTPPQSSHLRFFSGWQREDIDDVESQSMVLGGLLQRRLNNGWNRSIGLRLEQERYSLGDDSGRSTLLIPSLGFQRTVSDNSMDPSRGHSLMMDLQGAKAGVLSDIDFVRLNLAAKGLYTLWDNHRFLARAQLGGIASDGFASVPPSLRFFAGGDQSVRGYDYRTLAPTDETGERIGGRYLLATSAEYQYEFKPKWRAAVFVDHGNAVDTWDDPMKTSTGVGIRWVSPVGPIRLDLARSVSDPDEGFRIHFSMGAEL